MSASQERKKRLEERELGVEKKQVKLREQEKARKKTKKITISICAFLVLLTAVIIFFNSSILYKAFTAIEIEGEEFSVLDYDYYYITTYNAYYTDLYAQWGDSASYFMPKQDDLDAEVIASMKEVVFLNKLAVENNYAIDTEALNESVDKRIAELTAFSESEGYSSFKSFLPAYFGKGMNEKILTENLEYYYTAMQYSTDIYNSYEFSDEELASYYEENKDTYDYITFRYFYADGSPVADNADTKEDESIDSETAMSTALAIVNDIFNKTSDEDTFTEMATLYNVENSNISYEGEYLERHTFQGQNLLEAYKEWLLDPSRVEGDKTIIANDTGYYVLYFVDRDNNSYNTVDVRHILKLVEGVADDIADQDAAKEAANAKSEAAIEDIYQKWLDGDATEESFAALANEYSDDSTEGGLYENVYKDQMATEFNDWIFDESRVAGDIGIVHTEDYGYHLVYFVGDGMKYSDFIALGVLKESTYTTWLNENIADYTSSTTWAFKFVSDKY